MTDLQIAVRLKFDGSGVVGQVNGTTAAIDGLSDAARAVGPASGGITLAGTAAREATAGVASLGASMASLRVGVLGADSAAASLSAAFSGATPAVADLVRELAEAKDVAATMSAEVRRLATDLNASSQTIALLGGRIDILETRLKSASGATREHGVAMGNTAIAQAELEHVIRAGTDAYAAGTPISRIFGEELGRLAEAATFLCGSAGKVGEFFGGPWGIAIAIATSVLAPLIGGLFDTDEAAKAADKGLEKFQERQSDLARFIDLTNGKLRDQNKLLAQVAQAQGPAAIGAARGQELSLTNQIFAAVRAKLVSEGHSRAGPNHVESSRALSGAGGNGQLLASNVEKLAQTRPDLAALANTVAGLSGQLFEANQTVGQAIGRQRDLNTALAGGVVNTKELMERNVALATATDDVARAQLRLDDIRKRGEAVAAAEAAAAQTNANLATANTLANENNDQNARLISQGEQQLASLAQITAALSTSSGLSGASIAAATRSTSL